MMEADPIKETSFFCYNREREPVMSKKYLEFTLTTDEWSTVLLDTVIRNQACMMALLQAHAETLSYLRGADADDVRNELHELVGRSETILKEHLFANCGQLPEALRKDLDRLLGDVDSE